mmetsp:Transcript_57364/g.158757  ORF Transcript_57364/g.158757 Transcript_57364/m.158757 type:complete len:275 (+) Transcript_57364:545-1369(+)
MAASRSSLITLIGWSGRPEALPWAARRTGAATAVVSPATMLLTSSRDSTTSPPMRCSIQEPTFTSGGSSATLAALTSSSWQMMDSRVLRPWACNLEMSSSRKRCSSGVSLSPGRVSRNSWARASRANFASSRAASSSSPPKVEGLKTLRSPMAPPFSARAEPLPPPLPFSAPAPLPAPLPFLTPAAALPISSATLAPRMSWLTRTSVPRRRSSQPRSGAPLGSRAARACCKSFACSPRVSCESLWEPPQLRNAAMICSRRASSSSRNSSCGSDA